MLEKWLNKVVCGDSIELLKELPNNCIDLMVTDPPYNSSVAEWDNKNDAWQVSWLTEAYRVLKDGASLYVFFAPLNMFGIEKFIRENFTLKNIIVWFHPNLYGAGCSYGKDRYKSTWEVCLYAVKGGKSKTNINIQQECWKKYGCSFDVMNVAAINKGRLHKSQKPLQLIDRFVRLSSVEGDTVLDPFMGSGTTGVACKLLNRNFIGIEQNQDFVNIANKRIDREKVCKKFW